MEKQEQHIERVEISTPFDMIQQQGNPKILDLDDPNQKIQESKPKLEEGLDDDPNLEPLLEGDDLQKSGEENNPEGGKGDDSNLGNNGDEGQDPTTEGGESLGEEDEYDVNIKANLAKYAAEALKAQGGLPEDFEITDDITEADLDAAYVSYKEEILRNQIVNEERQRLIDEEGLTPQMIEEIKLKYYGVQDREIQELQALEYLSTYKFDENSETFDDDAKSFLTSYYALKGIPESRISKLVDTDLSDENLVSVITEAQSNLHDDYVVLDKTIKDKATQKEQAKIAKRAENKEKLVTLLNSGVIQGVTYTSEEMQRVKKALFEKTEIVVGPNGKKYRATLYYKKRLEAAQDLEKDLQQKINFILGSDTKALKRKEQEKTTKKILNKLNNYVDVSVKKPKKSKPKVGTKDQNEGIQRVEIN